ncbi:MAG: glycosyltransferase family 9 protein [Acidobacteriota bacterium]|nr:MAG: glycosyltransferase family 9 protein [Acidobacteriota bacterium]
MTNGSDRNGFLSAQHVLPPVGLIDKFIHYPNKAGGGFAASAALLLAKLRIKRFDSVFYLMPRVRTVTQMYRDERFFRLAGIKECLGFEYARSKWLSTKCGHPSPVLERDAEYLLDVVRSSGINVPTNAIEDTDLLLSEAEQGAAETFIEEQVLSGLDGRRLIGISPGSKWPSKVWPIDRYIAVLQRLVADENVFPVITGGPDDRHAGELIVDRCGIGAVAAGSLSVRETAALLGRCEMFLGNDSGPMHLAAAMGTPCVAIFAAIDWAGAWYPFGNSNTVFRRNVECEGCRVPHCHNDALCLKLIEPEEVVSACKDTLRRNCDK